MVLAVREVECRSILNRSQITDYTLNCYTGCGHACVYCYARCLERFNPHPEPWGRFVDVKANAPDVLRRQVRRARPGEVIVSSVCDGWQPLEGKYRLSRQCLAILLNAGFAVNILTKSALVQRDFDLLAGAPGVELGMTITTLDERLRALLEPAASPVADRLRALAGAREKGIPVYVFLGPLLPLIGDGKEGLDALMAAVAPLEPVGVYVDTLNPRAGVWSALRPVLARLEPGLLPRYSQLLYNREAAAGYREALARRVRDAAAVRGLADRLHVLFERFCPEGMRGSDH